MPEKSPETPYENPEGTSEGGDSPGMSADTPTGGEGGQGGEGEGAAKGTAPIGEDAEAGQTSVDAPEDEVSRGEEERPDTA